MNALQCKMARAALDLGVRQLAALAKVSPDTVARLERGEPLRDRTVDAIRAALEGAGVEFIAENGGGAGVRMKFKGIDVAQGPDGSWGVAAVWTEGAPAGVVSSRAARDNAVAAQRRGDMAWAERVIAAAALADRRNNNLDENGTPMGWTTDPIEADEGPGVWLNAKPAISDEAAVPEMPEGVARTMTARQCDGGGAGPATVRTARGFRVIPPQVTSDRVRW
jgi:hypothetical protein